MRWTLKTTPNKKKVSQLSNDLSVNPILASLLVQRKIDNTYIHTYISRGSGRPSARQHLSTPSSSQVMRVDTRQHCGANSNLPKILQKLCGNIGRPHSPRLILHFLRLVRMSTFRSGALTGLTRSYRAQALPMWRRFWHRRGALLLVPTASGTRLGLVRVPKLR